MHDITAVLDEHAVNQVMPAALAAAGTLANSGSTYVYPCNYGYTATATVSGGTVHLTPPNVVQLANYTLSYSLSLMISLDISDIIPDIHIPPIWIFPPIDIDWPTISFPVSHSGTAQATTDFTLHSHVVGPDWHVDLVFQSLSSLNFGQAAPILLALIGAAVGPALVGIPFIGPFVATVAVGVTTAIGIAGVTNLLGVILTPFITLPSFTIYNQPQHYPVLAAAGPSDPTVFIDLDVLNASVVNNGEPELVLAVDVSP